MIERMSLLIVDDRQDNLLVLTSLVKEYFPEVEIYKALSAADALRIAAEKQIDGALIDVQMPLVGGVDLCRQLKAHVCCERIHVILITSNRTTPELRAKGLEAGADDFIHRPFDNVEFVARLKVLFRLKQAEDDLRRMNQRLEKRVSVETQKLRQSEEKFRQMAELLPELVYECDLEGKISFANRYAYEKLGYTQDDFDQQLYSYQFLSQADRPRAKENLQKRLRGEDLGSIEYTAVRKDGSEFPILSYASLIECDGKTVGLRGLAVDITERKQSEESLARLNKQLITKNQELEEIIYIASHDMRSPLVSVEGFGGILRNSLLEIISIIKEEDFSAVIRKKLELPISTCLESIGFMSKGVAKMESLLRGFSQVSRLGRVVIKKEQFDMNELITDIFEELEFKRNKENATFELAELPPCYGDKKHISQLFTNLVGNAIKYSDPDRPCLIKITAQQEGDRSIYCVEDNGLGIEPEFQKKIFEMFHQLNPEVSGDGLGLCIASKVVEQHNGKIWVESEVGKGSRFYVSL